jgi:radical SAM superfamily enzyme YgiQ (UPF0313 family)
MDYVGRIFRPPSEAHSLLLQISVGCSHNGCTYCDMYTEKSFSVKPRDVVERDLDEARAMGPRFTRLFLCDGDALILSTRRLLEILEAIRTKLPWVSRVSCYGDTRSVLKKSVSELKALREAGLEMVYHGVESGSDAVLERIVKGGTREEVIQTAQRLREAGMKHSVILLLGIGGTDLSEEHARETASLLTAIDPPFVGVLTTTVIPGTPLGQSQSRGEFSLPGKFEMLRELKTLVEASVLTHCRFSSNHASNYLPLRSTLPGDKEAILEALNHVLAAQDEGLLKPEFLRGL